MVASRAELDDEQKLRIYQYYGALRDFFDITGEKHDRSNSARAQKARSKLLKLYPSQFFELSTDVHDELQRRIDEHQSQPDHLLPRENFHIKRNQARQKLANLSQMRFTDLVDDILYEIKRRSYDIQPEVTAVNNSDSRATDSYTSSLNEPTTQITPNASVQPSQVIPQKASIDWSSDEEERMDDDGGTREDSLNASMQLQHEIIDTISSPVLTNKSSVSDGVLNTASSPKKLTATMSPQGVNNEARRTGSISRASLEHHNKDREIQVLVAEGTKMDKKITELERAHASLTQSHSALRLEANEYRVENDRLASEIASLKEELEANKVSLGLETGTSTSNTLPNKAIDETFQRDLVSMSKQVNSLSIENEQLKQSLAELELNLKRANSSEQNADKQVVRKISVDDKGNFKTDKRTAMPLNDDSIKRFFSPEGSIPLNLVTSFNANIENIFDCIQHNDLNGNVGDHMFEGIARISDTAHQMITLVDTPDNKEQVILLKAAISHAITAIRFYAIYGQMLPKITVESAISEVSFAVCGLLGSVKISNAQVVASAADREVPDTPKTPVDSSAQFPLRRFRNDFENDFEDPKESSSFIDDHPTSLSPVKPLKITQKVVANSTPSKHSSRKPSSTLFASIVTPNISRGSSPRNSRPLLLSSTTTGKGDQAQQLEFKANPKADFVKSEESLIQEPFENVSSNVINFGVNESPNNEIEKTLRRGGDEQDLKNINSKLDEQKTLNKENSPRHVLIGEKDLPQSLERKGTEDKKKPSSSDRQGVQHSLMNGMNATMSGNIFGKKAEAPGINAEKLNHVLETENFTSDEDSQDDGFHNRVGESTTTSDEDFTYQALKKNMKNNQSSLKSNESAKEGNVRGGLTGNAQSDAEGSISNNVQSNVDDFNTEPDTFVSEPLSVSSPTKSTDVHSESKNPKEMNQTVAVKHEEDEMIPEINNSESKVGAPIVKITRADEEQLQEDNESDFDIDAFDIENPDNTLSELLLYLEHRTIEVISTIQSLLTSIKQPKATTGELRGESNAISQVIEQMVGATSVSMDQSRNASLKEHGSWVVQSLEDCRRRMTALCQLSNNDTTVAVEGDDEYADKHFKQRLAGIAFDVAKCTKELVKTVEEASLKEEIEYLNLRLSH